MSKKNGGFLRNLIRFLKSTKKDDLKSFFLRVRPKPISENLVRIGGSGDGGYLVPNKLESIEYCFSPGIGNNCTFEQNLSEYGIKSFMADYSVDAPPISNEYFNFEKKFLGTVNNEKFIRLEDWVNDTVGKECNNLLLQMDIEGDEYRVIIDTPLKTLKRFRIMIIEFHNLRHLLKRYKFRNIDLIFKKLLEDFHIIHIHPNNYSDVVSLGPFDIPDLMEFTFYRKDCVELSKTTLSFPHSLDEKNIESRVDIALPKCWWQ